MNMRERGRAPLPVQLRPYRHQSRALFHQCLKVDTKIDFMKYLIYFAFLKFSTLKRCE